jgi:ribosomal protein L7/L12
MADIRAAAFEGEVAALATVARSCRAAGGTPDQTAKAVLDNTQSPVAAIKALRDALPGMSLAEAKMLVFRNLPPDAQAASEQLWSDLERALRAAI